MKYSNVAYLALTGIWMRNLIMLVVNEHILKMVNMHRAQPVSMMVMIYDVVGLILYYAATQRLYSLLNQFNFESCIH